MEQEPVIFSESIRSNVVFGAEFNEKKYWAVLKKSCLIEDLKLFEAGDEALIGERGANLSGGQKARLALSRALYLDANIYLFDDPISAVDAKVGKHIFEEAILPLSKQKTVILVTHQVPYLSECDEVLILEEGKIVRTGLPT